MDLSLAHEEGIWRPDEMRQKHIINSAVTCRRLRVWFYGGVYVPNFAPFPKSVPSDIDAGDL